jgi:hypothetical protein
MIILLFSIRYYIDNMKNVFFILTTAVSASTFCDEFLENEIPQVVKDCGYSDIVPYCCSNKNIEILKSYVDDFQILCEDVLEQQQVISNINVNVEKLFTECSKQPILLDDWKQENKNNQSFICKYNISIILIMTLFIL